MNWLKHIEEFQKKVICRDQPSQPVVAEHVEEQSELEPPKIVATQHEESSETSSNESYKSNHESTHAENLEDHLSSETKDLLGPSICRLIYESSLLLCKSEK
ncbi:hypothetical protein KI387_028630, partial [Taxus chinensis]